MTVVTTTAIIPAVSGYRPSDTSPRGKWAIAINKKRRAEKISRTGAFELLGPRLGYSSKSLSAFRALDLGTRQPTEGEAKVLAEWLGYWPEDEAATESAATPDLAAAITALVAELQASRLERASIEERLRALEAAAKLRVPSGGGVRQEQAVPQGSGG